MTEGLPKPSERDFDLLRSSRRRTWSHFLVKGALCLVGLFFLLLLASYLIQLRRGEEVSPDAARERTMMLQHQWSDSFVQSWDGYRQWFLRHGIRAEMGAFDNLSTVVVESMLRSNSAQIPEEELSSFGSIYISLHIGIVRLLFLIIASLRLSLAAGLVACFSGLISYRPYRGRDALGQMGNGRVFYSGVRAGLDHLTDEGAPDVQVRGFACPQMCSPAEARASAIWKTLQRFDAQSDTNLALTQILVKNGSIAAYVAAAGEEDQLAKIFSGSSLAVNAVEILEAALGQHAEVAAGSRPQRSVEDAVGDVPTACSSETYGEFLKRAFGSVLTPGMMDTLASLPAREVATVILALESGKVLAHAFEGGRWVRRSNFPHLSARAVLHSIIEYPQDYDFYSRARIRRGLIYAARKSAFSPVRMPVDMSDDCWVLRQWAEVLLACPHELSAVVNEVELVGIVRESHVAWCRDFFQSSEPPLERLREKGFATATNLLFLPVGEVVTCMRRFVDSSSIMRMHVLLRRVAVHQARQRAQEVESDSGPTLQLSFEKVEALPSEAELRSLAEMHHISIRDLQDWLALRTVLSAYGWVASRVGDYSVPHSSIIFAVFRTSVPLEGVNSLGLLGRPGMVPLRGSKLSEGWGSSWSSRFTYVERATMAETVEDYGKLLQGIEDKRAPEDEVFPPPSKVPA